MGQNTWRRRSSSGRAGQLSRREAHGLVYHLLRLIEEGKATERQEKFFDVLVAELERRWKLEDSWTRCHCMMCRPSPLMGKARRDATKGV